MRDYDGYLEGKKKRSHSQPNGVSEDPRNEGWGHRSEMAREGEVEFEKQKPGSRRVNERREGEVVTLHKKDHGKEGHKASNENDDVLVDEGKSLKQKYADRYGNEQ